MQHRVDKFVDAYDLYKHNLVQQVQLRHRLSLVDAFQIDEGMTVLEIGCGQGDTTAALAQAVGETGKVIAIDPAPASYGAPLTLGEASERIKNSRLGARIDFHFETDLLSIAPAHKFDVAILSHCAWYIKDQAVLANMFRHLRGIAKRVCFAEWDIDFAQQSQRNHFLAASISELHAQYIGNEGNVQRIYIVDEVLKLFRKAGFEVDLSITVDASYLQDGMWELEIANDLLTDFSRAPEPIQLLARRFGSLMNASRNDVSSLNSFVVWAW